MSTDTPLTTVAHTPGPWRIQDNSQYPGERMIYVFAGGSLAEDFYSDSSRNVAELTTGLPYGDFNEGHAAIQLANARLIAAAPELLEALKAAQMWMVFALTRDPETTHPQAIKNAHEDFEKVKAAIAKAERESSSNSDVRDNPEVKHE